MKKIPLTQWKFALVDDEDFEELAKYKWCYNDYIWKWYALRNKKVEKKYVSMLMHREIVNAPKWMMVDHIDWNGLNNQRSNLRVCTNSENLMNRGMTKQNKYGYKWITLIKGTKKFKAVIWVGWRRIHIWYFYTPEEAYKAYCNAAKKYHGEFYHN